MAERGAAMAQGSSTMGQAGMGGSVASESEETSTPPLRGESRGRKNDMNLPPSRAREVQRAFRARRAAHLAKLEDRVLELEAENAALRLQLALPPAPPERVIELGSGPTGKGKSLKAGGVPMSERVKAKKERDRKKGITRSPDREDLDTRTKLEKLKQITSGAATGSISPSGLTRGRTESASVPRSETESAEHASPSGVGTGAGYSSNPYASLFAPMPMLVAGNGTRQQNLPEQNGMPFSFSDVASPAAGSSTNRQDLLGMGASTAGAPTPSPFNFGFPFNPFPQFGFGESPLPSQGGTPHTEPQAQSAPGPASGNPADSSFTQLMFLLAQNPEFQAKMAQAQQAAAAAALQGVMGVGAGAPVQFPPAFGAGAQSSQSRQNGDSAGGFGGMNLPFGLGMGMGMGAGAGLNNNNSMAGGMPSFPQMTNASLNFGNWQSDNAPSHPFNIPNGEQSANDTASDPRRAILSPSFPDGEAPLDPSGGIALGLSRAPDEVSGRLRPPSFSSDTAFKGGMPAGDGDGPFAMSSSGQPTRPASSSATDSPVNRPGTAANFVNVNGKRPASALQSPAFAKPSKRDSVSTVTTPASAPANLSQAPTTAMGGGSSDEVSLLDRLKNCCRIPDARSGDSALMLFASRLCLAVPCNYAGLHDHDGQTAPGYRTVEDTYDEMRAVLQQHEGVGEDHPSGQLAVGRLAGERLLKAVKEEMSAAVALSRETMDDHVHGRRVGDWIGCRPATGFGISENLIRKVVAEEAQQQQ